MVSDDEITLAAMVRSVPVDCLLFTAVPVGLAAVQLANSYINGLSVFVSVPFAVVMVMFAGLLTQHQLAQFRRQQFERALQQPTAD